MTIKEVEIQTGLSRANIRFYESEGLISPSRGENGYRDYNQEQVELLLRIKLLRSLRVPLSDIAALIHGEAQLLPALDRHIESLQAEQGSLQHAISVCREMQAHQVDFQTLDARYYLASDGEEEIPEIRSDVPPLIDAPWRRLFARDFDFAFYQLLVELLMITLLRVKPSAMDNRARLFGILVILAVTFLLEPLFLHLFATTPGKWIMGLYVTDNAGEKLSFSEGLSRTWLVFTRGLGCCIPFLHAFRLWKSYSNPGTLEWEYNTAMTQKDRKNRRFLFLLIAFSLLQSGGRMAEQLGTISPNRGEITVQEFCQNYNTLDRYLGSDGMVELGEYGQFETNHNSMIYTVTLGDYTPWFSFEEENGLLKSVTLHFQTSNSVIYEDYLTSKIELMLLSFPGAELGIFSSERDAIRWATYPIWEGYTSTVGNYSVTLSSNCIDSILHSGHLLSVTTENFEPFTMEYTIRRNS